VSVGHVKVFEDGVSTFLHSGYVCYRELMVEKEETQDILVCNLSRVKRVG
jgi:hypothetical protein